MPDPTKVRITVTLRSSGNTLSTEIEVDSDNDLAFLADLTKLASLRLSSPAPAGYGGKGRMEIIHPDDISFVTVEPL